jgi:hypothetical protein
MHTKEKNMRYKNETLKAVLTGKTIKEMAEQFEISEAAVKFRLQTLYKSMGVKNKTQLLLQYVTLPSNLDEVVTNKSENNQSSLPSGQSSKQIWS